MSFPKELHRQLVGHITGREPDPALWLIAVKRIVLAAGLRPERCMPLPTTLDSLCFAVVEEAQRQGPRHLHMLTEAIR